jgi:hypothetical protein
MELNNDIKAVRASLKPVGDPFDWENNENYMSDDNFKIRLFDMFDDVSHYLKTGDKTKFISSDDFLAEMDELRNEAENGD